MDLVGDLVLADWAMAMTMVVAFVALIMALNSKNLSNNLPFYLQLISRGKNDVG
jgi:hypothetical protein